MRAETDRRRPPLPSSSPQEEQVVNIALTHDIVPRAFACDYSRVVGILKRLNRGFKEHHGLAGRGGARKAMFAPIGHLLALQPSEDLNFVKEGPHPMLPAKPGLFHISSPRGDADSPRSPRRRGGGFDLGAFLGALSPRSARKDGVPRPRSRVQAAGE